MPRPGPRPYECVRRAWHSDRHQPMRGSIIQQIFRVVHESHSSVTKKNREWQEKLPIVVLKAEKIMYSKANSEAEYMDLETVWDRVNDAINTIIRRDESAETGELLPPCIEAALELGCVPVKASRSQRQSNPRTYLPPRAQEPSSVPPRISVNTTNEQKFCSPPIHSSNQLTFGRPLETVNSIQLVSGSNRHITQNNNASCNFPLSREQTQFIPMESSSLLDGVSVYPLYYGTDFPLDLSKLESRMPKDSNSIVVGTPIFSAVAEPAEVGSLQNLFSSDREENASNRITVTQPDLRDKHGNSSVPECDLSLRLGFTRDSDDICSISSQEEGKFSHISPSRKEFPFFPMKIANDPFEFRARKWNPEGEGQNAEEAVRKRKAPFNNNVEDEQFFCAPGSSFYPFSGRMTRPGS